MKIIDLLNKIANGEEVPKKIKYNDKIWRLASDRTYFIGSDYGYDFWAEHGDDKFEDEVITLNDEVEILEEEPRDIEVCGSLFTKSAYDKLAHSEDEKKIPKKLNLYKNLQDILNSDDESIVLNAIHDCLVCEKIKINEILDYLESKGESNE